MNKKIISLMLVLTLVLTVLVGCGDGKGKDVGNTPENVTEDGAAGSGDEKVKIAIVHKNLGDLGFVDESHIGLNEAKDKLGIEFDYAEIVDISEVEMQLRMFADSEEYDLIIALGADYIDPIIAAAADYPEQKFTLADGVVEGYENIHSIRALDPEQTFLSGVIAGLVTKDERMPLANKENIIGFVGGMDTPVSRSGAAGFMAGAKYVNPEVEFIYNIVGSYTDPGTAKEIAMTAYGRGADVISHNAGGSGLGVFNAAEESNKYVIGSSKASIDPERSLVTSLKRIDLLIYQEIESVQNGTWKPGVTLKGIKDDVCGYDRTGINTEIPQDIIDIAEEVKQQYFDGKFELPQDPDQIDEWTKNNNYERNK